MPSKVVLDVTELCKYKDIFRKGSNSKKTKINSDEIYTVLKFYVDLDEVTVVTKKFEATKKNENEKKIAKFSEFKSIVSSLEKHNCKDFTANFTYNISRNKVYNIFQIREIPPRLICLLHLPPELIKFNNSYDKSGKKNKYSKSHSRADDVGATKTPWANPLNQ